MLLGPQHIGVLCAIAIKNDTILSFQASSSLYSAFSKFEKDTKRDRNLSSPVQYPCVPPLTYILVRRNCQPEPENVDQNERDGGTDKNYLRCA